METITLNFKASGQTLTADANPQRYASNTVNYIQAVFDLDDNWKSFDSVRAVWHNDFACISTVLDGNGACTVPHEVLTNLDEVHVNLVGSNVEGEELVDRMTTYPLRVAIIDANARICGTETAEVTPSQFEQFIAQVAELVGSVRDIDRIELNEDYTLTVYYSDGTSWTSTSIRGEQGETGNGIASAVLNDDYTLTLTFTDGTSYTTSSIRGEQGPQGEPGEVTMKQLESVLPTDTASGAIASFPDGSDLFDYLSCIVNIEPVQAGSGTPSPDNVRPITGWTGCEVSRAGVNLWDEEWELGTINTSTGAKEASTARIRSKNYIPVASGNTYTIVVGNGSYNTSIRACFYDANLNFVSGNSDFPSASISGLYPHTFSVPNSAKYMLISPYIDYGTTYKNDISINYPSTDHSYHAYNGTTHPVSWQTEAGTVYGGTVDVVTGVLTAYPYYTSYNGETLVGPWVSSMDEYIEGRIPTTGAQVVDLGGTPTTYQLTPTQVQTLLGQNNVWADCGDVEVQYKADVQRWVEKKLAE